MPKHFSALAVIFLCLSSLSAALSDHLKAAPHKPEGCGMRNIDFIYLINLDQRPEKYAQCMQQLSLYGIEPYRFSAVNGWELSLEAINDVGLRLEPWMTRKLQGTYYEGTVDQQHEPVQTIGRVYFCHCTTPGTIGISLSHISVLQDAYNSGYETIWVMEDDIDVIRNPLDLSTLIDRLDQLVDKDWDILFTDRDIRNQEGEYIPACDAAWRPDFESPNIFHTNVVIGPNLRQLGARYGAHSMILRRRGIEKLLRHFQAHHIFLPYDMEYTLPPGIKLYTVLEDVVSNLLKALSDNGAPRYLTKSAPP